MKYHALDMRNALDMESTLAHMVPAWLIGGIIRSRIMKSRLMRSRTLSSRIINNRIINSRMMNSRVIQKELLFIGKYFIRKGSDNGQFLCM